ncbi:ORF6N domain-containing protein [Parafilimonas sp.]|uniref:ORF6N domain-containing protein n=1 Tax=Parafilimonas sp. TaxID=1969739 RepID=UPI003F7F6B66
MPKIAKTPAVQDELIMCKIYLLRSQKIMLDRDLAALYGVKPIRLREQVKRNNGRFPANFMFQLTEEEVETMVSQNAIPSRRHLGGALPYAFTEHGVLMLANVLKTQAAMNVSIRIIEIFVKMRDMLSTHKDMLLQLEKIERQLTRHDDDIALIFDHLKELLNPPQPPRRQIGFKQQGE